MVTVQRKSMLTGIVREMQLPLTEQQFVDQNRRWKAGTLIQKAFPTLNSSQREFLMTGIIDGEWDNEFGDDD